GRDGASRSGFDKGRLTIAAKEKRGDHSGLIEKAQIDGERAIAGARQDHRHSPWGALTWDWAAHYSAGRAPLSRYATKYRESAKDERPYERQPVGSGAVAVPGWYTLTRSVKGKAMAGVISAPQTATRTILLVEDEPTLLEALRYNLAKEG